MIISFLPEIFILYSDFNVFTNKEPVSKDLKDFKIFCVH